MTAADQQPVIIDTEGTPPQPQLPAIGAEGWRLERARRRNLAREKIAAALAPLTVEERGNLLADLLAAIPLPSAGPRRPPRAPPEKDNVSRRLYRTLLEQPDISTHDLARIAYPECHDGHQRSRRCAATLNQLARYGRIEHIARGKWRAIPNAYDIAPDIAPEEKSQ